MSHNSAEFQLAFHFQILLETKKLQAEVLNSTCRTIQVFKLL